VVWGAGCCGCGGGWVVAVASDEYEFDAGWGPFGEEAGVVDPGGVVVDGDDGGFGLGVLEPVVEGAAVVGADLEHGLGLGGAVEVEELGELVVVLEQWDWCFEGGHPLVAITSSWRMGSSPRNSSAEAMKS
jgi:hypothetical protein